MIMISTTIAQSSTEGTLFVISLIFTALFWVAALVVLLLSFNTNSKIISRLMSGILFIIAIILTATTYGLYVYWASLGLLPPFDLPHIVS